MTALIALTTVGSVEDARRIASDLVDLRLAACVNIIESVRSIYRWQGRVTDEEELLLIIKTMEERVPELRERLMEIHPYEVPEFVVVRVDEIGAAYGRWLEESTLPH
jgi:periplasmic divalent cation tolerance protein